MSLAESDALLGPTFDDFLLAVYRRERESRTYEMTLRDRLENWDDLSVEERNDLLLEVTAPLHAVFPDHVITRISNPIAWALSRYRRLEASGRMSIPLPAFTELGMLEQPPPPYEEVDSNASEHGSNDQFEDLLINSRAFDNRSRLVYGLLQLVAVLALVAVIGFGFVLITIPCFITLVLFRIVIAKLPQSGIRNDPVRSTLDALAEQAARVIRALMGALIDMPLRLLQQEANIMRVLWTVGLVMSLMHVVSCHESYLNRDVAYGHFCPGGEAVSMLIGDGRPPWDVDGRTFFENFTMCSPSFSGRGFSSTTCGT